MQSTDGESSGVGQADIGRCTSISNSVDQHQINDNDTDEISKDSQTEGQQSWRQLLEVSSAKSRKIRGSNYVQLATIDPSVQEPRCRCVVFRGFLKLPPGTPYFNECSGLSCVMRMITDKRSQKVHQVIAQQDDARSRTEKGNNAELLWWFPKTTEQYRIRGELVFVGGDGTFEFDSDPILQAARKEQWGNLSDSARESFFAEQCPGEAFANETANIPPAGRDSVGKMLAPPDSFLLMLLVPSHCDYLRLSSMYRQIDEREENRAHWTTRRVNP